MQENEIDYKAEFYKILTLLLNKYHTYEIPLNMWYEPKFLSCVSGYWNCNQLIVVEVPSEIKKDKRFLLNIINSGSIYQGGDRFLNKESFNDDEVCFAYIEKYGIFYAPFTEAIPAKYFVKHYQKKKNEFDAGYHNFLSLSIVKQKEILLLKPNWLKHADISIKKDNQFITELLDLDTTGAVYNYIQKKLSGYRKECTDKLKEYESKHNI